MATDPTMRVEYVEMRWMAFLQTLTLTGTPAIRHTEEARIGNLPTSPWGRVTFRPQTPIRGGRIDATYEARMMSSRLTVDLFWPNGDDGAAMDLYAPQRAASELDAALDGKALTFFDYAVPAAPVAVTGYYQRIIKPVEVEKRSGTEQYRRWRVTALIEWIGKAERVPS